MQDLICRQDDVAHTPVLCGAPIVVPLNCAIFGQGVSKIKGRMCIGVAFLDHGVYEIWGYQASRRRSTSFRFPTRCSFLTVDPLKVEYQVKNQAKFKAF